MTGVVQVYAVLWLPDQVCCGMAGMARIAGIVGVFNTATQMQVSGAVRSTVPSVLCIRHLPYSHTVSDAFALFEGPSHPLVVCKAEGVQECVCHPA